MEKTLDHSSDGDARAGCEVASLPAPEKNSGADLSMSHNAPNHIFETIKKYHHSSMFSSYLEKGL